MKPAPLRCLLPLAAGLWPALAHAIGLELPAGARETGRETEAIGSLELPVSAWRDGGVETLRLVGQVERTAWQVPAAGRTTLQMLEPLREQLLGAGYEVLFECEARQCGGFDFRYAMDVLAEPAMHVDLGDYHYVALRRPGDAQDHASLLVSRSRNHGFVQITQIGTAPAAAVPVRPGVPLETVPAVPAVPAVPPPPQDQPAAGVVAELQAAGRAVLSDLAFDTGSSSLSAGPFDSLADLAAWMNRNPDARVVLVGHTDATGALAANIALSKRRAEAVRERLVAAHGVAGARIGAEGVGYLAPLVSNATEAGRERNRRVEAVLAGGG